MPFHEVAHQWWGNVVAWNSYRDQWLDEAIAAYLSLMFAESEKSPDHAVKVWLGRYRQQLITKSAEEDRRPIDVGPLVMGSRLTSSRSPNGYETIVYDKGAWVIHMIREMLRQPGTANPDARFTELLRTLVTKYEQKPLSTEQFRKEVEKVMTPKMDLEGGHSMEWFFDQYVEGTGIPKYKVEFSSARKTEKDYVVKGKLIQTGVPESFLAPVPLYAGNATKNVLLGTVVATGEETSFTFHSATDVRKIVIDPNLTLLCVTE